jgi:hypothetical protein
VLLGTARGSSTYGGTEPDLDLIKQVEHVTISALERPAWRFAAISERGDQRRGQSPRISDLAITALTVVWLQKQPAAAERDRFAKGQSGNATGGSTNRAIWAAGPLLCHIRRG